MLAKPPASKLMQTSRVKVAEGLRLTTVAAALAVAVTAVQAEVSIQIACQVIAHL